MFYASILRCPTSSHSVRNNIFPRISISIWVEGWEVRLLAKEKRNSKLFPYAAQGILLILSKFYSLIESVKTMSMWNESTKVPCTKMKHYLRHENKVNKNKVLSYCEALRYMRNNKKKVVLNYVKHTNTLSFKLDFQKVDQHTRGKWLIHGTKCHKDNQLQSLMLHLCVNKHCHLALCYIYVSMTLSSSLMIHICANEHCHLALWYICVNDIVI